MRLQFAIARRTISGNTYAGSTVTNVGRRRVFSVGAALGGKLLEGGPLKMLVYTSHRTGYQVSEPDGLGLPGSFASVSVELVVGCGSFAGFGCARL